MNLVAQGDPVARVAKGMEISEPWLRRWIEQGAVDDGRNEGLTSSERKDLVELRRCNRVLDMEIEILKRASASSARENPPKTTIRLVQELAVDGFSVAVTCRVLEVPTSTYYEAISREPSAREVEDQHLTGFITEVDNDSRGTYSAPRVHAELRLSLGVRVGRERAAPGSMGSVTAARSVTGRTRPPMVT